MAYNLRREQPKVNYEDEMKLPRPKRCRVLRQTGKLYPVEVVETDGTRVKIHYVGYADEYDKWREAEEPESSDITATESEGNAGDEHYVPLKPHKELLYQIKASTSLLICTG